MNKYILINESLGNIDIISRRYMEYLPHYKALSTSYIGEELQKRQESLNEEFRRSISTPANAIRLALVDFIKEDDKGKPVDVNNQALFNVGNVLATREGMDFDTVANLVKPFASDKQAIGFLKSMAMDTYKGFVAMYEMPEEELKSALSKINDIFYLGAPCIGEISDVRRVILQYARVNGLNVTDSASAEFEQLRAHRIASMMGVNID